MKCKAILLAGGSGSRFGTDTPKQFVEVDDVPIIVYTLRKLQVEEICGITIVCIKEWIGYLRELVSKFRIEKVENIVPGGVSAYDSICIGFNTIKKDMDDDDIILVHDSVRPLLPALVVKDSIEKASLYGNGFASIKNIEGLVLMENDTYGIKPADRYHIMRIQTPQSLKYSLFAHLLAKAENDNKKDFSYTEALLEYYGEPIFFSRSFTGNMKITTRPDIAFFKAMLQFSDQELLGETI